MPIHDFRCRSCGQQFELLVRGDGPHACPHCAGTALDKLLSRIAPHGHSREIVAAGRRAAAREGHFSHYSRADRARVK
ncbi:MAG: zinc ribbon domain-containing protein [Piscinibacter sp.]|nr:zinc ribbon domain-containing protein [Piscinibacter sp.]